MWAAFFRMIGVIILLGVIIENASGNQFVVFDGLHYADKPDLTKEGFQLINIPDTPTLWGDRVKMIHDLPSQAHINWLSRKLYATGHPTVVDIEHWEVREPHAKGRSAENISKYLTILQWLHVAEPKLLLGYYALPPLSDYWRAIESNSSKGFLAWQKENDSLKQVVNEANMLFPSLYTYYKDRVGWVKYAVAQIKEARRCGNGKPVYVFLWPQYHDSSRYSSEYIEPDYWRLELETARQHADGIVIWGGTDLKNKKIMKWDDQAPWWIETKKFLKSLKQGNP
jgi:hypothetical protein